MEYSALHLSRLREWYSARILSWYAFREHLGPFVFALTIFTFIMLMNQVARQFQQLAGKGLGADVILEVFMLSVPLTIAVTIPMATLVATMAAFGRMAGDNEITAIQANGVGFHQILAPALTGAAILAAVTVLLNDTLLPEANHRLSMLLQEIQRAKPTVVLQEQRINDPTGLGEYRILPERIDRTTNTMYGVRIFDTTDLDVQRTIVADSGRMEYAENGEDAVLTLWSGAVHSRELAKPGEYVRLSFDNQQLVLHGVGSRLQPMNEMTALRSDREMDLGTLLENVRSEEEKIVRARGELAAAVEEHVAVLLLERPAADSVQGGLESFPVALDAERYQASRIQRLGEAIDYSHRQRNKFLVEYHKKFAIPVACIVFLLIGAPIGVRAKRGGYGFAMGMSTGIFVAYYLALTGGEDLADRRFLPPWLSMWMANIVFLGFGLWLLRRTARETASRSWLRLPRWIARRKRGPAEVPAGA